jgi:hypothetical protein
LHRSPLLPAFSFRIGIGDGSLRRNVVRAGRERNKTMLSLFFFFFFFFFFLSR